MDVVENETAAHQNSLCCNGLSPPNISVLDKLIKTCPVWLQLCMDQQSAAQVLRAEPVGVFLVRKDAELKLLILSVHISTSDISEYRIKEEKSMLYLEGSALVFEDIFKLVGFYCVSRDVLPFTLKLPHAILEAKTHPELDAISNLGTDFWSSSLNIKAVRAVLPQKGANTGNTQLNSTKSSLHFSRGVNQSSCEIEMSVGNDRLWFVKPIFIEECGNALPHDKPSLESKATNKQVSSARPSYRRPPPPPPPIAGVLKTAKKCSPSPEMSSGEGQPTIGKLNKEMEADHDEVRKGPGKMIRTKSETTPKKCVYPVIPPRRRSTGKYSEDPLVDIGKTETNTAQDKDENKVLGVQSTPDSNNSEVAEDILVDVSVKMSEDSLVTSEEYEVGQIGGEHRSCIKSKPLPPPRKKRFSHQLTSTSLTPTVEESINDDFTELANLSLGNSQKKCNIVITTYNGDPACDGSSSPESKKSSTYLINPALNTSGGELDSISTSSTEDDLERANRRPIKKTHSIMLDRAKNRLSLVNLSSVFSAFLSADRKLQKKIIELAQGKETYFGHLVQDYKAYSLEMMAKHSSSTEMLQEIRLMMTQLKSYLLQSAELQIIIDPAVHKEEKIEVIAEAALCKCVLKPLKEAINSHLCIIHTDSGALRLMKENQQVVQGTTTTELGVTTSVPEAIVIDKILNKFTAMHKAYSPEKKITFLLKACKLIYDSMSTGTPGKSYGADDFLPVLMYVLARCSLTELLLDVEYMMELMDPALQLGEGSYYLTTTYGALEHIKNYDKVTVTRQLSMEVQDSIHRWEKRRTLSKTRVSRTSVQDFITIAFQDSDSQTRTLAIKPDTYAELLAHQCALKFEVAEPHRYGLFILVDERCLLLASDAQPHKIKSYLLKSETKKYFHFVYKEIGIDEAATAQIIKEPNFLE